MLQQALQKIRDEIGNANKRDKYVAVIGSFLTKHLKDHPEHAELIVKDGKTIAGSLKAMQEEAKKQAYNGQAMFTDEEGFAIVLKYYGVKVDKPAEEIATPPLEFKLTLDDLL